MVTKVEERFGYNTFISKRAFYKECADLGVAETLSVCNYFRQALKNAIHSHCLGRTYYAWKMDL